MDTYSKIILTIKFLLLVSSLSLIIAVGIIANKNHIDKNSNLTEILKQYELDFISKPISTGQTESGMNYIMKATASQNNLTSETYDRIFETFQLELTEISQVTTNINSDFMYYNSIQNSANLVGNIFAHNSIGQELRTDRMIIDFSSKMAQTLSEVQIKNSDVTLHSGKMIIENFGTPSEYLFFTDGVSAIYIP